MPRFPSKLEDYKALRAEGKTPEEIIESGFCSRATANRHERTMEAPMEVPASPDGIRVDAFDTKKPGAKKPAASKKTPITEHTAGMILQGVSQIAAFMAREQRLALTDEERDILEVPFTESLSLLPADIAKGVNKYAAPGLFLSQFVAIYTRKMTAIALEPNGGRPKGSPPPEKPPAQVVYENTNREAVRAAAAAVAAAAASVVHPTNGKPANVDSTGTLEPEGMERKTEFEA